MVDNSNIAKVYTFIDFGCLRFRLMCFISLIHQLIRFYCRNEYLLLRSNFQIFDQGTPVPNSEHPRSFFYFLSQTVIRGTGKYHWTKLHPKFPLKEISLKSVGFCVFNRMLTVIKSKNLTLIEQPKQGTCHSRIDSTTTSARNPNQYK